MNDEISIADTDTDTKRGDEDIANVLDSSGLNLTEERKNKVVEFLMGMGAVSLDDMRFLTEDDLQGYLLPLQCRRLLHFIKEQLSEQKGLESASTSVQSSNVNRLATVRSNAELDYQLEEDTLPGSILKYLREKIRLPPADRRLLIRMIAADLLSKCSVPGRKLLRNVALKVVLKYPKSLADFGLSGKFLGDGCGSFILQLENCVSNTRRLHKKRPADTSCSSSENEAGNERRKSLNSMHLQNENYSTAAVVPEELESCRNALLTKFQVLDENTSPLDEDTQVLMHKCYSGIRSIINSLQKSVIEIRSEWPILFTKSGFQHHYHHLVGKDFQTFDNNLRKNLSQLLAYMQSLQLKKKKLKLVVKQINDAKQSIGNNQPEILGMLDLLSKYFHEDFEKLVMKDSTEEFPDTPCIVAHGSNVYTASSFDVLVDKKVTFQNVTSVTDALCIFFGCYYVFNIQYPVGNALTLEFLQWSLAEINSVKGNNTEKAGKNKSRMNGVHGKVLSLLGSINDFCSCVL